MLLSQARDVNVRWAGLPEEALNALHAFLIVGLQFAGVVRLGRVTIFGALKTCCA